MDWTHVSPRQITRCGLCVALLAVGSSISVPLGPVPFTLQTLVLAMLPIALGGRDAVITVAVWMAAGAIGLPVFSGFSGGIGHVLGPTGGFIWGFLVGTMCSAAVLRLDAIPEHVREGLAAGAMLLVSYALGTLQLVALLRIDPTAALGMAVLPFVVPDVLKLAAGIVAGRAVKRALSVEARTA